jgi:NiFe hydrogenase small subunit HydA
MKFCGISASALGLDAADRCRLKEALDNPNGPMVIWLQGNECTGCSVSFLSRISISAPSAAKDVLIKSINLADYPNLTAPAGKSAPAQIEAAYAKGGYVLAIAGGVPANFGWSARWAWSGDNQDVTLQQAVLGLSAKAGAILAVGTCAAFGGTPAAPPDPNGVKSVKNLTGKTAIHIAGCPPLPGRIAWVVVQLLLNKPIFLDSSGRPRALFNRTVRRQWAREETEAGEARTYGGDDRGPEEPACRGKQTLANCPRVFGNGKSNRCKDGNAPCLGCKHSNFPNPKPFYRTDD